MRNGYNVVVDTKDIKTRENQINQKYDELCNMIKNCQKMFDDTEAIYDTPSSKIFRAIAYRYLDIALLYLNNDFKEYVDKLDDVVNLYSEFNEETKATVGNGDKYEI